MLPQNNLSGSAPISPTPNRRAANNENKSLEVKKPTLPSGGGSLAGFDEQYHTDGFTGTASLSFGGLRYNSGSGNGPFGMGFGASTAPSISRRTSFGTPSYVDTEDTFMWGGEVLVPLLDQDQQATVQSGALQSTEDAAWVRAVTPATGDYQVRLYRHRHEANFEQIQYWTWQGDSPATGTPLSFWRIIDKDNNEHLYGVSRAAQIADPYNINHIYKWLHQETLDAQGHGTYIYYLAENTDQVDTTSSAEANRVQGAQKYLWRVCSGHPTPLDEPLSFLSTSQLASQAPDWYFETVYDYGQYDLDPSNTNPYDIPEGSTWSKRQDSFSNYLPGFEIRTHRLCQNVMRFHRFTTLNDATPVLTHVYRYHYDASPICSLLSTVEDIAYYLRNGSYETQYNPPLEITYSGFQPREQEYRDILESDSLSPFPGLGNGQPFVPVDLFNEGIEGFLYSDGTSDYYLRADWGAINNDTPERPLTFSQVDVQMPLPVGRFQNAPQRMLTDITANGQLDYLISKQGMTGYFEVARDEEWSSFTTLPNFPTESRNVKRHLVDVTGDGINDCLMMTYQGLRFYRSLQQEGYADPVLIEPFDLPEDFPISWESSETIKISFADMDGGGKSHLVKVTHEGLTYWPNLGHGYFGQSISMENFPSLSYQQFKDNRVFFADVDGSGTADLIVLFSDGIKVYLNQCGNSFADPIELPLPNGEVYDPLDRILFADVYGTGMACMIYSKNHVQAQQWCYQFSGGIKPYLLTSFDNNMGGKSSIEYRSSVHYYLEDQANGVDWLTRAPFPVHVVASMTATDEISGSVLTNTRSYRHSYYDGVEREFRGFGYVETLDTQVFDDTREIYDSFPAKTKTWLRTGSPDQNEITAQYQSEFYSKDLLGTSTIDYGDFTSAADQTDVPREAQLVLSGTPIRQEVYGMDETASAGIPYSVTENNHIAHLVQPKADNPYASLQIRPKETLHYHYERRPEDALIEHEVALRFDQFGHVMQSASITYPRNPDYVDALDKNGEQSKVRCHSQTALYYNLTKAATQIDSDLSSDEVYLLGIPYDQRHYHIANLSELLGSLDYNTIYAYGDLQKTLAANVPSQTQIPFASKVQYTLRSWKKNEYYYPTDTSAGSGEVAPQDSYGQIYLLNLARTSARAFLLPYQSLQTAYVQEELATIMGDFFTSSDFSSLMGTTGDYLADTDQQYWWVPSGTHTYGTATHFYLPQKYTDPKGSTTSYQYDDYNLLLLSTSDALKNTVTATAVDYQTLHPYVITDANGNSSEVLYDAHGRVLANSYYGTQTLAGESSPTKLGFDSLYGSDPYEIQSPNSLSAVLAAPYDYLQNAAGYYYYDLYSMMGQVTEQDYKTAISGIDSDALSNWWTAQLNAVLINPAGALYAAYRQFIAAADSASDFGQALSALSSDLGDAYAAFSTKQQQSIFQLLQAAISSTTLSPVHSLALMAEDYPSDSQARLTTQDYEAAISGIDSDTLSNWLAQLQKNEQIDAQDVFSGDYRGLVQTASSASDFATALGKISSALNSAFTAFGDDEEQVFNLQKTALYRRIKQLIHYSDGFGRMLQDKIKAEDGSDGFLYNSDGSISKNTSGKTISNRWLTSGHKVYNNKGQVVRQYEPYYIDTTDYVSAEELNQLGASPTNFYDPLGRVYQMYTSKGFLVRKQWSAWGMSTWDANDTLPFSPFYLVNEQNILNGDTTPPAQGSTYYDFRYYFNAEMTQAERDTYQNSLPLAWTPSQQQHDNRGLPLWMTKTDGARFTETTFTNTFPSNGKGIYQNLITVGYLATRQTRSTVEQDQQTSQQTSEWAQLTTAFPFPSLPLSQTEYQVQAPGILSILYQQKLADKAVNESAFTALGYTTVESQALWKALVGAGILDSKGMVSTKLAYPSLTGLDQEYQSLNNQIVTLLIQQWAVARPLRSFRTYDSYGRILTLADPRLAAESLVNMTYTYPATMGGKISSQSCDAGQEWKLVDVIGRPLWSRDEKGYVHTYQFDALHRPTAHLVAYQKAGSTSVTEGPVTTERMLYGESVDNPEDYNLRGKPYQHFDQAQWQYLRGGYTIQGKLVGGVTQLTKAYRVEATTTTPLLPLIEVPELSVTVSKLPYDTNQLQSTYYSNQLAYDALGRLTQRVDTAQQIHRYFYHESGPLAQRLLNGIPYVKQLVYNAKGQRTQSQYNSSTSQLVFQTFSIYDPKNYRNVQLFSTTDADFSWTDENELIPSSQVDDSTRQDLVYTFDPVGNITQLAGNYQGPASSQSPLTGTQQYSARGSYDYDGSYRMISAGGMEQAPSKTTAALSAYQRNYGYDDGDNLTWVQHQNTTAGQSQTIQMYTGGQSNRAIDQAQYEALSSSQQADLDATFLSDGLMDVHGNLLRTDDDTAINWNYQNQMQVLKQLDSSSGNTVIEYYTYGQGRRRSRKITMTYNSKGAMTQLEVVFYLDLEYRSLWTGSNLQYDGETVTDANGSVSPETAYQSNRIRLGHQQVARYDVYQYQKGAAVTTDNTKTVFFVDNHIDSCQLLLDSSGAVLSYEEFYPYGGTSFSSASNTVKHYRYSGQERDQTDLYYYGMRYYSGSRFRWLSPDPAGFVEGLNLYAMVGGNPVTHRDVMGMGRGILGLANRLMAVMRENIHIPGALSHRALISEESRNNVQYEYVQNAADQRQAARDRRVEILRFRNDAEERAKVRDKYREYVVQKENQKHYIIEGLKKGVKDFFGDRLETMEKLHAPNLRHVAIGYRLALHQFVLAGLAKRIEPKSAKEVRTFLQEFHQEYEKMNASAPKSHHENNISDEEIIEMQGLMARHIKNVWIEAASAHVAGFIIGYGLGKLPALAKRIKDPELRDAKVPFLKSGVTSATVLGHLGGLYVMERAGKTHDEISEALFGGVPIIQVLDRQFMNAVEHRRDQMVESMDQRVKQGHEHANDTITEH